MKYSSVRLKRYFCWTRFAAHFTVVHKKTLKVFSFHVVAHIFLAAVGELPADRAYELVGQHILADHFIQVLIARHVF